MTPSEARKVFDEELRSLQDDLQKMGAVVEDMLGKAIEALAERDVALARQVEDMDDIVDRYNVDIETKSLRLLALQQPMARDLRTIAAAMKIITDVERAGDYAVDIAKLAERLADRPLFKPLEDIPKMARTVQQMLRETLTAFVTKDLSLVQEMIAHDEEVDHLYHSLHDELVGFIERDPKLADQAVGLVLIARYLERIADHITNIGERIYYMQTGELKELHM
ncbi:MAG TPA: phosphate signaling complex protein PhoU [Armatimonadota bacterium]|nr:phosphate signaling complex protein PhoU [Armatimonadota bacterium]